LRVCLLIAGDFEEIAVGVAEVDRDHGAEGSVAVDGALFDGDFEGFEVGDGLFGCGFGNEAEVGGAGGGFGGLGVEGVVGLVEVDLHVSEVEGPAAFDLDGLEAEGGFVKVECGFEVRYGENEVVQAEDGWCHFGIRCDFAVLFFIDLAENSRYRLQRGHVF